MKSRQEQGFTIVELLIVGAVLAILATLAVPMMRQHYRSALVRGAGPQVLTQVMAAQERYRAENGTYTGDIADLAAYNITTPWKIPNSKAGDEYALSIVGSASATSFKAMAQGTITGGSGVDTWTIDQDGNLEHVDDGS